MLKSIKNHRLDSAFADYGHGKGERAKIHRNDVDDGVMDFLCTIPVDMVERSVRGRDLTCS